MLTLSARGVQTRGFSLADKHVVLRLRSPAVAGEPVGDNDCLFAEDFAASSAGTVALPEAMEAQLGALPSGARAILLPESLAYLRDGDIVALEPAHGVLRVLYRRNSQSNSLLVTERCNHYCLMCSQPPKDVDDTYIYAELERAVPLIDKQTLEIGITGGEPTLGGERFLALLRSLRDHLPRTAVHVLSNGRSFVDPGFAAAYAGTDHHDVMVGIPIYADYAALHDYIVQSDGAFDETIRGILNLKARGARVEIRVVVLKQNSDRLVRLAEFLARNLTFVDHVALMALEVTGFARANLDRIWVDPFDYGAALTEASLLLEASGMRVSIYNHQLCTVDRKIWHLARRSISDWKNEYLPECASCAMKDQCAGFFATGRTRYSAHIHALTTDAPVIASD
jgi:His-Xaa-Ser system radical SAM maturase HxsC